MTVRDLSQLPECCPRCGAPIHDYDRDSSSGYYVYYYSCTKNCGWIESYGGGVALWKALKDAESDRDPLPKGPKR